MKNFINLILGICIVTTFYSCKKADVGLTSESNSINGVNVIQSAPATQHSTSRGTPNGFSIGLLSDWVILGVQHTEVELGKATKVNGGKTGVGPAGKFEVEEQSILNSDVFLHNGVHVDKMEGIINGSYNLSQNLAYMIGETNRVSDEASKMTATVTLNDVTISTTILGNGTTNVINMHKLKLDHDATLVLSGNSSEQFIINITDGMELEGTAKIITAGGARSSNVLINILGHDKHATSKSTNTINATILAPDSEVEVGNVNGQIISGGEELETEEGAVVNFIAFGS